MRHTSESTRGHAGVELEMLGLRHGVERRGGESDIAYRRRLWAELLGEEAGNVTPERPRDPTMVSEGYRPWWRRRRGARS